MLTTSSPSLGGLFRNSMASNSMARKTGRHDMTITVKTVKQYKYMKSKSPDDTI